MRRPMRLIFSPEILANGWFLATLFVGVLFLFGIDSITIKLILGAYLSIMILALVI